MAVTTKPNWWGKILFFANTAVGRGSAGRGRTLAVAISAVIVVGVIAGYLDFLARYASNGVYFDDWNWVELMRRNYAGNLTLNNLWTQHNENRMLFPNALMLILGNITGFDEVAFMYLGAFLLVVAFLTLVVACRREVLDLPLAYVPVAFVFFSLAQYENTLWGFQFAWFLVVACICAVLALLSSPSISFRRFLLSVTLGVVASYSSLAGLTVWGAGLLVLLRGGVSSRWRVAWCGAGAVVGAEYLNGLNFASVGGPPLGSFLSRVSNALTGFLVAVGSVAPGIRLVEKGSGTDFSVTILFGALVTTAGLLVLVSWIAHGRRDRLLTVAGGLVVVGLSFDILLMPTRLSAAVINGTASRYTTFNLLLLAGVFVGAVRTLSIAMRGGSPDRIALTGLFAGLAAALLLVQIPTATRAGELGGKSTHAAHSEAANLTANHDIAPTSLVKAYAYPPSYTYFQREAAFLEANHLNVFGDGESARARETGILAGGEVALPLPVPPEFGNVRAEPDQWRAWLALSSVYEQRSDLQTAFPGPTIEASRRMVRWAVRSGENPADPIYAPVLAPYSQQYAIWLAEES